MRRRAGAGSGAGAGARARRLASGRRVRADGACVAAAGRRRASAS